MEEERCFIGRRAGFVIEVAGQAIEVDGVIRAVGEGEGSRSIFVEIEIFCFGVEGQAL